MPIPEDSNKLLQFSVMKNGEMIKCPHCGEKSLAKEKREFDDDFSLKSSSFFCALCGGKLEEKKEETAPGKKSKATDRLAALLGEKRHGTSFFAPDEDDGKVCLHCRHCIKHPFMDRCGITMREVDVMESCDRFEAKEE